MKRRGCQHDGSNKDPTRRSNALTGCGRRMMQSTADSPSSPTRRLPIMLRSALLPPPPAASRLPLPQRGGSLSLLLLLLLLLLEKTKTKITERLLRPS